jgi:hypothetical protein
MMIIAITTFKVVIYELKIIVIIQVTCFLRYELNSLWPRAESVRIQKQQSDSTTQNQPKEEKEGKLNTQRRVL